VLQWANIRQELPAVITRPRIDACSMGAEIEIT